MSLRYIELVLGSVNSRFLLRLKRKKERKRQREPYLRISDRVAVGFLQIESNNSTLPLVVSVIAVCVELR